MTLTRFSMAIAALTFALPASAATLTANCDTLGTVLAKAKGGDTVNLSGECGETTLRNKFPRQVTINAAKAKVKGLRIYGENITWLGGVLLAPEGLDGPGPNGYAVTIRNAQNIRLADALLTDANSGIVMLDSRNVKIEDNRFWRLRADGIIATGSENVGIDRNRFSESLPLPTVCTMSDGSIINGVAKRDCKGKWRDGTHPDWMQLYNGMKNVRVRWNYIVGEAHGVTTFGNGAPVEDLLVANNYVASSSYHQISTPNCIRCSITFNKVRRGTQDRKATIKGADAARCGNDVQDERSDGKC